MLVCNFSDAFEEIFHAEGVLVVGGDEGGGKEDAIIEGVGVYLFEVG
jgi:hypothetical protein